VGADEYKSLVSLPSLSRLQWAGGGKVLTAITAVPFSLLCVDVAVGNVLAPAYEKAALHCDVPRMLEAVKASDYCVWKASQPEAGPHSPPMNGAEAPE